MFKGSEELTLHVTCVTIGEYYCYAEDKNLESWNSIRYFNFTWRINRLHLQYSKEKNQTSAYFHLQFPEYLEVPYIDKVFDKMLYWHFRSKTYLTENIKNSEMYKDRNDGYGGVVIIYNNVLQINEIQHEKGELVFIRV